MAKKRKTRKTEGETQTGMGEFTPDRMSRLTAPPELEDPGNRKRWGLGEKAEDRGPYMVELNVQYVDGLAGAATAFVQLFNSIQSACLKRANNGSRGYSITSSARDSRPGATVRPSALAVLRLITSANLVGCSIGRSAGLLPLSILST